MLVTKELRQHLQTNCGLLETASDADVTTSAMAAIKSGKLSTKQLTEFVSPAVKAAKAASGKEGLPDAQAAIDAENPDPQEVFKGAGGMGFGDRVNVKRGKDLYSSTKQTSKWPGNTQKARSGEYEAGRDAFYTQNIYGTGTAERRPILEPSPLEIAKIGAISKFRIISDVGADMAKRHLGISLNDHDRLLINEAIHEDEWVGPTGMDTPDIVTPRKLSGAERKSFEGGGMKNYASGGIATKAAVLGDTSGVSGGEQAIPQYFDFEAIRIPLLFGELVPYVEITPTDRGKAAHSYSIGTPTYVTTASGSAISPFDATGFVSTYDVPFFPVSCGFQWGRDFEMDAAPNFGKLVVAQLGDQFKYQLDYWIPNGDGTTQPEGLGTASGTVTVSATGTSHQTMVYNDALNLAFGVTKPYRKAFGGDSTMFVGRDSMYKKFMQLVTGVTGDARPIYGMHLKDYQLGDYHFAVQNDIADGRVYFANLRGYRLYRRLGLYFELITAGQTLTLSNLKLLFARARFGGKLTLGGYCAKMSSLQIG